MRLLSAAGFLERFCGAPRSSFRLGECYCGRLGNCFPTRLCPRGLCFRIRRGATVAAWGWDARNERRERACSSPLFQHCCKWSTPPAHCYVPCVHLRVRRFSEEELTPVRHHVVERLHEGRMLLRLSSNSVLRFAGSGRIEAHTPVGVSPILGANFQRVRPPSSTPGGVQTWWFACESVALNQPSFPGCPRPSLGPPAVGGGRVRALRPRKAACALESDCFNPFF
jgi:hypothetical protein